MEVYSVANLEASLGTARTTQIGAQTSSLQFDGFNPEQGHQYQAELTSMPSAPMPVALIAEVEVRIDVDNIMREPSGQIREFVLVETDCPTTYIVRVEADTWRIEHRETEKLIAGARGDSRDCALHVFDSLNKIAHWERTLGLQNHDTKLDAADIDFHLVEIDDADIEHRVAAPDFTFDVKQDGDYVPRKTEGSQHDGSGVALLANVPWTGLQCGSPL
jgi:hypothetical protein